MHSTPYSMRHILFFLIFCCALSVGAQNKSSSTQKARTTSVSQKKTATRKTTAGKKTSTRKKSASKKKQATPKVPVTKDIKRLQDEHATLQKQISESQHLLSSTKKDVKSQLANLALINGKISAQQNYVTAIQTEVDTLAYNLKVLDRQLLQLEQELAECKRKFTRSVMYMYRNRQTQNKLMFVFSAENFQQMYRRLRYVQEYARYQRAQGRIVEKKEHEVAEKRAELEGARKQKQELLNEGRRQQQHLESQKKERQEMVDALNKKQKQLQKALQEQQRKSDRLNARIDQLIREEIRKAEERRKAEEARRKAEEERRARERAATENKTRREGTGAAKGSAKSSRTSAKAATSAPAFKAPDETDLRLSSNFAANQGRLPVPITGSYVVTSGFGRVNAEGLKGVYLDNKGINITGKPGAQARSVFDGEVTSVFDMGGMKHVIVRHGSYLTVYCNLSSVAIRVGQKVSARQALGNVARDDNGNVTLHFQIRKEAAKLNPASWVRL